MLRRQPLSRCDRAAGRPVPWLPVIYVRDVQLYPQHQVQIAHLVPGLRKLESDEQAFAKVIDRVRAAAGVL